MQNELISILIPFKNTAIYLTECLQSVINQTETNWEVIAIDDGSTDQSHEIVSRFASSDERIQLYKNNNQGLIPALKLAYAKSSGNFITRMDSDDIMAKTKLKVMREQLISYGKGHIATGMVKYFSEQGISPGFLEYENWLNALTQNGNNYSEIYKECVIASPCWMVYRSDFETSGGFNSDLYPEDYDLVFRFYKYGLKCLPSSELLHHWRDYSWRTSRTHDNYTHDKLLHLKLRYFLELDYSKDKTLVVWGAGRKGKLTAKYLIDQGIDFVWICDNPKKIGKHIYNQELQAFAELKHIKTPQSIITVANKDAQKEIREHLISWQHISMVDYFFFC